MRPGNVFVLDAVLLHGRPCEGGCRASVGFEFKIAVSANVDPSGGFAVSRLSFANVFHISADGELLIRTVFVDVDREVGDDQVRKVCPFIATTGIAASVIIDAVPIIALFGRHAAVAE